MKILREQEEYFRKTIRDAIALNPLISIRKIQQHVEDHTGRNISDKYLMKLLHKVRREVVVEYDRKQVSIRLTEVKEKYRVLIEELSRIVYWTLSDFARHGTKRPSASERIQAIRTIAQMEMALIKAELDVGLFEDRRLAIEEMLREGLLPTALHEEISIVFRKWKFIQTNQRNVLTLGIHLGHASDPAI